MWVVWISIFLCVTPILVKGSPNYEELRAQYQGKTKGPEDDIFSNNAKYTEYHPADTPHPDASTPEMYKEVMLEEEAMFQKIAEAHQKDMHYPEEKHQEPDFSKSQVLHPGQMINDVAAQIAQVDPTLATSALQTELETEKLGRYNVREKCWRFVGRSAKSNKWMEYFSCGYDPSYEISPKHDGLLLFMDGRLVTADCEYKYVKGSEEVQSTSPPYENTANYHTDGKCENC